MNEASEMQVDKVWTLLADIVLGEPVHGEVLSREYRVAMQRALWTRSDSDESYVVNVLSPVVRYAMAEIVRMVGQSRAIAEEHDAAIIQHAQYARWRNLYRLTKKSGQAKGKAGDR